jgi:hypothetical protein
MEVAVIAIKADFNRINNGRLLLSPLAIHERTPFEQISTSPDTVLFVQGTDIVQGHVERDPQLGWVGVVDWSTQDVLRSYPADSPSIA